MMKNTKKLALTQKQSDKLWGEDGPYSEARLIFCSRVLDTAVSRIFVEVEVAINPLTFEMVQEHREHFKDDEEIQQLLDHSNFRGQDHGYVSCAFSQEHISPEDIEIANLHLQRAENLIIRLHRWVIRQLDTRVN